MINPNPHDDALRVTTTTFPSTIQPGITSFDVNDDGTEDLIAKSFRGFFVVHSESEFPQGDFNRDGEINIHDVDLLCQRIRSGEPLDPDEHDLNSDGIIDQSDVGLSGRVATRYRCRRCEYGRSIQLDRLSHVVPVR